MEGYIKIDRKILKWEWWDDINTFRLFVYMLLKANWKDGRFKGIEIKRGSFVSSVPKIAIETSLTVDEVRTAIKHLKETEEITCKSHGKFTVFTINNYCSYQDVPVQIQDNIQDYYHVDTEQLPNTSRPIPDLFPTDRSIKQESRKAEKQESRKADYITDSDESVCRTDVQLVVDAWNELQEFGVPPVSRISSSSNRYKRIVARIREYNVADVLEAIEKIKHSDFLLGRNNKGWLITFDWFVLPNNFPKVLEGNYNNKQKYENNSQQRKGSIDWDNV